MYQVVNLVIDQIRIRRNDIFLELKKNFTQLEEWARLIPRKGRPLTYSSNICDLHFDNRYIQKSYKHVINGVNVEINMGNWRLSADAKSTIFQIVQAICQKIFQNKGLLLQHERIASAKDVPRREMHTDKSSK